MPALDRFVGGTTRGSALGRWIEQSGVKTTISAILLIAVAHWPLSFGFVADDAAQGAVGLRRSAPSLGFALPFMFLNMKRTSRMRAFEEGFPEALDLIARALKAGHAFITGLKMVADEMPEPIGPEFRKTFDEQNFGLPLKDALENLTMRVPGLDVRFFATAVLIQRETGGNLSEILENLAHVVRERFKILRQVRVYTAHGRMTGYVLLALPAVLCIALAFINPGPHEPAVPRAHGPDAADGRADACRPSATSGFDRSSKSRCSVLLPLLAFVFGSVLVGGAAFALMPNRAIAIDRRLEELTSGRARDEDDDRPQPPTS